MMRCTLPVTESLVEDEVGQLQATERRLRAVARVYTDGAVRDVDAVAAQAPAQGEEGGRRMAEQAGLARVVFEELHVARPEQRVGFRFARMFAAIKPCVNVERVIVFVIERHLAEEFQVLWGHGAGGLRA